MDATRVAMRAPQPRAREFVQSCEPTLKAPGRGSMQRDMRRLSRLSVLLAVAALALVLAAVAVADKPAQPPGQAKKQQQVDPPAADAVPPGQAKPKKAQDVAPDDAVPADDAAPEPAAPAKPDKAAKRDDAASAPGPSAPEERPPAPQPAKPAGVTELTLHGGNFAVCDAPAADTATAAAAKRRSPVVRRLWGTGHGRFRTRGRYAAATVRGTTWTVEDRCHSTVTK